jgi:hypothetical protein
MKITAIAMMAAGGMSLYAGAAENAEGRTVTVCMTPVIDRAVAYAKDEAQKMFAGIGVNLEWRPTGQSCPADALLVSLDSETPPCFYPSALAYALPFEGTHIHVFYDRVQLAVSPRRVPRLLAHVLAHEITHILEGVVRHSTSGVMKAPWDQNDYQQMAWKPLSFAAVDIYLIYRGVAARAIRLSASPKAADQVELGTRSPEEGHGPGTLAAH